MRAKARVIIVDFHAEATSEKVAMGWHLDGRVTAVFGTHTHVQTADDRILPKGTAYLTDAGMTGPHDSIIGVTTEIALAQVRDRPAGALRIGDRTGRERRRRDAGSSSPRDAGHAAARDRGRARESVGRRRSSIRPVRPRPTATGPALLRCPSLWFDSRPTKMTDASELERLHAADAPVEDVPGQRRHLFRHRADRRHPRADREQVRRGLARRERSRTARCGIRGTCISR